MSQLTRYAKSLITSVFGNYGAGVSSPAPILIAPSLTGDTVTADSALKVAAVMACTRFISQIIASLPFGIVDKRARNGVVNYVTDHRLHSVLNDTPAPGVLACSFWESFVSAMLLVGNGYAERLRIGDRVVGLRPLSPGRLSVSSLGTGAYRYYYAELDGRTREIAADDIWRVPGYTLDGETGLSAISYGANVIGSAIAADSAAATSFKNGLMPTIAYQYQTTLKGKQRDEAREYILGQHGALMAGTPVILENGMTAQALGINARDAQLLESRAHSRIDVCALFGVPPWMVGYGEKSTAWGTGMEQQMLAFQQFVIQPILTRIEQGANVGLLSTAERVRYAARYDVSALMSMDSAARAAYYDKLIKASVLTPDEARAAEGRDPLGGNAGKLLVNSGTSLLESLI